MSGCSTCIMTNKSTCAQKIKPATELFFKVHYFKRIFVYLLIPKILWELITSCSMRVLCAFVAICSRSIKHTLMCTHKFRNIKLKSHFVVARHQWSAKHAWLYVYCERKWKYRCKIKLYWIFFCERKANSFCWQYSTLHTFDAYCGKVIPVSSISKKGLFGDVEHPRKSVGTPLCRIIQATSLLIISAFSF